MLLEVGNPFFECLEQVTVVSLFYLISLLLTVVHLFTDLCPDHFNLLLVCQMKIKGVINGENELDNLLTRIGFDVIFLHSFNVNLIVLVNTLA